MTMVAVGGILWKYRVIGQGDKNPLLILHGWGRTGNEWISMAEELSRWSERKVYVVDLPGFGESSLPQVKTIFEYSQLVKNFCKYIGIDRVVLIGHSLGGRIGIVLALQYREFIEKLVLVDPAGVKIRSIKRIVLTILAKIFSWVPQKIRRLLIKPLMDSDSRSTPALEALYRAVVSDDLRKYLKKIYVPTYIVWGEKDAILPLSQTKVYARQIKDCVVRVVWDADHDPHLTKYEQTLAILQEACE